MLKRFGRGEQEVVDAWLEQSARHDLARCVMCIPTQDGHTSRRSPSRRPPPGGDTPWLVMVEFFWPDVPLSQLKVAGSFADDKTHQAVEDWHYWTEQGYEYSHLQRPEGVTSFRLYIT